MANQIVIAGGGTAGWMCAAAMARMAIPAGFKVALIESDEIGTIGVGEATIPSLHTFNAMLGINEDEFLRETGGTFKLGIEFVNWGADGTRYLHPFGQAGYDVNGVSFHQYWLKERLAGNPDAGDFQDYSLCASAALSGKFCRPGPGGNSILTTLKYAFHFDAGRYAGFLRRYAEGRGVKRIEGKITDVALNALTGEIVTLRLADGDAVSGDFFVDCTGFRARLIGEALGVAYEDWSRYLPCDRAIAVPSEAMNPPRPFTRSTADAAGWRWEIPLQHRTGNGHVYCSAFMSDETAKEALMAGLGGPALGEARALRFRTGRRVAFWKGNCVALGLAAGFLEPLESTSIHLIQTGIARLMAIFPASIPSRAEIDEYNDQTALEYEQARDFLILHYKVTRRDDTPFWRQCREMPIPDTLSHKIDLFKGRGRTFRRQDDLFTTNSWLAVMLGQGIMPLGCDPLSEAMSSQTRKRLIEHVRESVRRAVQDMPKHVDFIAANCASNG